MKKNKPVSQTRVKLAKSWQAVVNFSSKRGLVPTVCIMSLLAIGLFYLGYTNLVSPKKLENQAALNVLKTTQDENERNRAIEETEPQFKAEFRKAIQLYRDAQPLLPSNVEVANVLAQVQESAKKNGVTLTGFNAIKDGIKSPSSDKLYEREYPALVVGKHEQVVRFFNDVARMERIVLIRDFSVVSLRDKVSVALTLVAYNSPPPQAIPALPKEFGPLLSELSVPKSLNNAGPIR